MAAVKQMRGNGSGKKSFQSRPNRQFKSPLDKAKAWEIDWPTVAPMFEATRDLHTRRRVPTYVYFIGEEDEGAIKIGFGKDPIARLRSMQTGNPRRLKVEGLLVGTMHLEKLLHELWEEFAIIATGRRGKVDVLPGTEWHRPEVRQTLFPIVKTAMQLQLDYLYEGDEDPDGTPARAIYLDKLEDFARAAHVVALAPWLLGVGRGSRTVRGCSARGSFRTGRRGRRDKGRGRALSGG